MLHPQGELTISADMEELSNSLFFDSVPESWSKRAYPSLMGLTNWFADLQLRIKELEGWSADFQLPNAVWLAGNDDVTMTGKLTTASDACRASRHTKAYT